jgi:DHA2 family multidrug resistance protein
MSTANAQAIQTSTPAEEQVDPRRLIAFIAMCFGMFMAVLDIQIVSASLAEIQAGLAASQDEISWVQTAYLIAEVIAIPLSGFLSRALGTRIMFATAAAGFTVSSLICGFTTSMNEMIFWRAVQGFIGGGMIPTVFASIYTIFPRSKQQMFVPIIGLVATLAPTVGPTVGGYLTDALSWHWLFFINVVPGILVTTLALALIDFDEPDFSLFKNFDWWGLGFMAAFLGALEYVLEEGTRWDWFDDPTITLLTWVSGLSAMAFFARVLTAQFPIVDLKAYANRNFALGSLFSFVLGIGLYGLTYLFPLYLEEIRGDNALMVGETLFVSGVAMFVTAPIVGRLGTKVDPRFLLMAGFLLFAVGAWQMTYLTKDWDFAQLLWPQIFRGVGLMLAMIPITNVALGTLEPSRLKNASGLFNLSRNLGGAVGLAALNTVLDHRIDLHLARLHESVTWGRQPVQELFGQLTARFQDFGTDAQTMALKQLMALTRQQGVVMGFADVFLMLAVLFAVFGALAVVLRRPAAMAAGAAGGH